jgi:predicted nuclease with RNAse H fold
MPASTPAPCSHGMGKGAVLGLDLTAGRRPSGSAVLDGQGHLLAIGPVLTNDDILSLAARHNAAVVAIDSPLGLPLGVDCFDEAHDCAPVSGRKGKASERALSALGIPCYYTTKRSIIRDLVLRAMALTDALTRQGHEVIEVYPFAVKVRLWCSCAPPRRGCRCIPPKTTPAGIAFLRERLMARFPNLPDVLAANGSKFSHDAADSLLAAWTAHLYRAGNYQALGDEAEGAIILPA